MKTLRQALVTILIESIASFAGAVTPTGPDAYVVETATDLSYVGETFAVPDNAPMTLRKGIFYPKDGPKNVSEVVWRNVQLTDVTSFSARMRSGGTTWVDTEVFNVKTNADGSVECQFQRDGNQIYCFVMKFQQSGTDVTACILKAKRAYKQESQPYGGDFNKFGVDIPLSDDPFETTEHLRIIADLGCTLREDVLVPPAPSEIRFVNADESETEIESQIYTPCLMSDEVRLARDILADDVVAVECEMSFRDIQKGAWVTVQGYGRTNRNNNVQFNMLYKSGTRRMGGNLQFRQKGRDVVGHVEWAGHSYDDNEMDAPFGIGAIGVSLGITNEANTASFAFRNIRLSCRPRTRFVRIYQPCLMKEWVKVWSDASFGSVVPQRALMGGEVTGKKWMDCQAFYLKDVSGGVRDYLFQWQRYANEIECIEVQFKSDDSDMWAKVVGTRWGYGKVGESTQSGNYRRELTNRVDGVSSRYESDVRCQAQALCSLIAVRSAKNKHTVTVDENFSSGLVPIRLEDMKLTLAPSAGQTKSFASAVSGFGSFGVAGRVTLDVDLPVGIALEVDSGAAIVSADRMVEKGVSVAAGAALEFQLANGSRPKLSTGDLSLADGAKIVLSGELTDIPDAGETIKLIAATDVLAADPETLVCETSGGMTNYRVALTIDGDGDLAVTATPKKGLMLIFR